MDSSEYISLAIFPFEDLSLKNDLHIFCRSFSSDLATELSRFSQFQVINGYNPPASAGVPAVNIHNQFNTDYFIQGTFRCEKEMVRINVQLYNAQTQFLVLGKRLEGKLTELFEMQEHLLTEVVGVLQQQINHDLLSKIKKKPKVAFRAYEHWLNGMDELKKGSVASDLKAREHFKKALEIQPNYSLGYSGMSLTYFNEWSCQLWERWDVAKTGAYDWAQKAIELDDQDYVAAMVLGKIFLYEGSYETAEYYLRRSLLLNPNDPDTLVFIAGYFTYLGYGKEAIALFERTLRLNPLFKHNYFNVGSFIFFELGEFEKAASYVVHADDAKYADSDAFYAAIYYYLDDHSKMKLHWDAFLGSYHKIVRHGKDYSVQEAIEWLMKVNPFKFRTNLEPFLEFISNGLFKINSKKRSGQGTEMVKENFFLKETGTWRLSFEGSIVQLPEVKGFYDLQKLLSQPRRLFHSGELMGNVLNEKGEKLMDDKAKAQYREKITGLQAEIEEAEQEGNYGKMEKLHEEYETLISHLSKALGLKGKYRETGSPVEKARSAVTWRIRNAIARIERNHNLLGAHLSNAVKTGTFCSYQPDRDMTWVTS